MDRRARTHHLIELGGLVAKAGLPDLFDDDRATLYGALLDLAIVAQSSEGEKAIGVWKLRGHRKFNAEGTADDAVTVVGKTLAAP